MATAKLLFLLASMMVTMVVVNGVKVQGNKFYDDNGKVLQLRGVSHSGTEYSCVHSANKGGGIFEGPYDSAAVAAIKSWGNTIVRIPLNEDCWLGVNGVPSQWAGVNYQKVIHDYVKTITDANMVAILDLHWTADGSTLATKQDPMPDSSHAIAFWTDVAKQFSNNTGVMFEIFNEPFPGQGNPQTEDWVCWRNGTCPSSTGVSFQAAGMQQLHQAVRATGAPNVILLGALAWSNDLDGWLQYSPAATDPLKNTAAVWHSYDFNACNQQSCWDSVIKKVANQYPIVVTESGFKIDYVKKLWPWCESNGLSYMAWTWNVWGSNGEGLVSDYSGTPTSPWGTTWKSHLASIPAPSPSPPPPSPSPPSSCPGGSLSACIGMCPSSPPIAYKDCVAVCTQKCT